MESHLARIAVDAFRRLFHSLGMETRLHYIRRHYLLFLLLAIVMVSGIASQFLIAERGDKNWMLVAADLWLSGKKLYVDIFEVNPPLIFCAFSLPVWLSHAAHMPANYMLVIVALVLVTISITVSLQVIMLHPLFTDRIQQLLFTILLGLLLIQLVYPSYFADREHLFMLLIFPYLLRWLPEAASQMPPKGLRLLIGIMAGLGFCIKPHAIIIFLAVQLFTLWRERSFAILFCLENLLIYSIATAYIAIAWVAVPDYFHTVLPMAFATYGAYKPEHYVGNFFAPLLSLGAAFADFRLRTRSPFRKDMGYLSCLTAAAFLYVFINNGWGYTFFPLATLSLLLVAWVWWEYLWLKKQAAGSGPDARRFSQGTVACLIVFTVNSVLMMVYLLAMMFAQNSALEKEARKCVDQYENIIMTSPGHSYGGISLGFYLWPEFYRDIPAKFETRFYNFWMMMKFHAEHKAFAQRYHWIIDYVTQGFADDLIHNKPGAVFVENEASYVMDYLKSNPGFVAAWKEYKLVDTPAQCGFMVYRHQ